MTADTALIRMCRLDTTIPWGFRLQGGKDYMAPMIISRVIHEGLAEKSGLREGDFLLEILGRPIDDMTHEDAQQLIINSANELSLKVERTSGGARIWKPLVKSVPVSSGDGQSSPVKYSLAHDHGQVEHVGSKHNIVPKPFGAMSPGSTSTVKAATNNNLKFNTPQEIYSQRQVVLEPTTQQQTGSNAVDGQNDPTKKEEPAYLRSATLKLIHESEKSEKRDGGESSIGTLENRPENAQEFRTGSAGLPACDNCGRPIQGVFCKASGKQLHPECFVCTTCGSNLKSKGFYVIGNKLYCNIHAKQQGQNHFKATPPIDPNLFYSRAPPLAISPIKTEPIKASYQPEILKRGEMIHGPKATSMSPAARGVPTYSPKSRGYFRVPEAHELEVVGYPTQRGASPTHLLAPMQNIAIKPTESVSVSSKTTYSPNIIDEKNLSKNRGGGGGGSGTRVTPFSGPKRGRTVLKQKLEGNRIPQCRACAREIRGPFIVAINECWCTDHFVCSIDSCRRKLLDVGFVELDADQGKVCCELCFENYMAPRCGRCSKPITTACVTALQNHWHTDCFKCGKCQKAIGSEPFFLEGGMVYCEKDWTECFTTKCANCQFPIETGDRFVEALNQSYHADCFTCTICHKSLEGQSFYGKKNKPYCESHV